MLISLSDCQHYLPNRKESQQTVEAWQETIAYAKNHLPHHGILVQQSNGYAYLKVDNDYINKLFPLLKAGPEFSKPPYFRRIDSPGAHISLFYEDEHISLKERGRVFSFEISDITIVKTQKNVRFIILQVRSPDLEKLRTSYGLSPKLKGHEFHISLAISS